MKKMIMIALLIAGLGACNNSSTNSNEEKNEQEKQLTFTNKNHALDNNDNFSPDNKFLCYDTRETVFKEEWRDVGAAPIANTKTIEKVDVLTGSETVLWNPESVTGENGLAAPGVGAASYHPTEDKVVFMSGPDVDEVKDRGYYGFKNRTGVEVSADGKEKTTKLDLRDISNNPTTNGAQRGSSHRLQYSKNGQRIGFTYDDYLDQEYDRTVGFMQKSNDSPEGYTHYVSLILKPAKKGSSKPGEIEKAYGDSWVDRDGTVRAFIGKVRAENGIDYETSVFTAIIPKDIDITTANSGNNDEYPIPAEGIVINRLTHTKNASGIVRGSNDEKRLVYLDDDKAGIQQVFIIPVNGSDIHPNKEKQQKQVTYFKEDASAPRWHTSDKYVFSITNGNIAITDVSNGSNFGKTTMLTNDDQERSQLVVSNDGKIVAYNITVPSKNDDREYQQIFTMDISNLEVK